MKAYTAFGVVFITALFAMALLAETIWAIPICLGAMIISFICGALWRRMVEVQEIKLDGVTVEVYNEELKLDEIRQYIDRARLAKPGRQLEKIQLIVDGEDVEIVSEYASVPFERIRRITGYLVGRLGRTSKAKEVEIADRKPNAIDNDLADVLAEVYK